MGRKSRIARGLDIGAAARKMMEKAIGVALTDEEYWDLEHGRLTVDEILEARQARVTQLSQKEWWMPYAQPLPTWHTLVDYNIALRNIRRFPPSNELKEDFNKAFLAGLSCGEGYFAYFRYKGYFVPMLDIGMGDKGTITHSSKLFGVGVYKEKRPPPYRPVYHTMGRGLKAMIICRLQEPFLKGWALEKARFLVKYGFKVNRRIAENFIKTFKGKRRVGATLIRAEEGEPLSPEKEVEIITEFYEVEPPPR